jgi:hypothetical protein
VASHRRIALEYLLAYAQTMRAQQADALERMAENARDGRFLCCRVDYIQTMPKTVWLDTTRHQAFIRGVRKGFAAPFLLFSDLEIPPSQGEIKIQALPVRRRGSIVGDWEQVGRDIRSAIEIEQGRA